MVRTTSVAAAAAVEDTNQNEQTVKTSETLNNDISSTSNVRASGESRHAPANAAQSSENVVGQSVTINGHVLPAWYERSLKNLLPFVSGDEVRRLRKNEQVRELRRIRREGTSRLEAATELVGLLNLKGIVPLCGRVLPPNFPMCLNPANMRCEAQPAWCDSCAFMDSDFHKRNIQRTTGLKTVRCEIKHFENLAEQLLGAPSHDVCCRPPRRGGLRCLYPPNPDCNLGYCDSCAQEWVNDHNYNCALKKVKCKFVAVHFEPYLAAVLVTKRKRIPSDPEVIRRKAKKLTPPWNQKLHELGVDGMLMPLSSDDENETDSDWSKTL